MKPAEEIVQELRRQYRTVTCTSTGMSRAVDSTIEWVEGAQRQLDEAARGIEFLRAQILETVEALDAALKGDMDAAQTVISRMEGALKAWSG